MPTKALLSDVNNELITTWNAIKKDYSELMNLLNSYLKKHNENAKEFFYYIREQSPDDLSDIELAARFIYLNKTCFNGIYRVNKNNKFNTPFNNKENIKQSTLFDVKNIKRLSNFLNQNKIEIKNCDFQSIIDIIQENDFIFLDPPYDFDDQCFDKYTSDPFGKEGQYRLQKMLIEIHKKRAKWILTNHDTKLINELYKDFHINKIPVNRFINSDSDNRVNATFELIITNYELSKKQKDELDKIIFFKELKSTSFILKEYVSWDKIKEFIKKNKFLINDLNNLFSKSKEEFKNNFDTLFKERQECFKLLPILLANNNTENNKGDFIYIDNQNNENQFNYQNKNIVYDFIEQSGLIENVFVNSEHKDIKTYLFGLKVGLSSHDKKNKSGKFMAEYVQNLLNKKNIKFSKEVELNKVFQEKMKDDKRFDFSFKIKDKTYFLECNFFNDSGSKINSEIQRFVAIYQKLWNYKDYEFIYVVDGPGLKKNKEIIISALDNIKTMFNLSRFEKYLNDLLEE